jgi:hypothetical protein
VPNIHNCGRNLLIAKVEKGGTAVALKITADLRMLIYIVIQIIHKASY